MNTIAKVHCPNCGSPAERHFIDQSLVRTQCPFCDYLMVTCRTTGKVVEAYAPGISCDHIAFNPKLDHLRRLTLH